MITIRTDTVMLSMGTNNSTKCQCLSIFHCMLWHDLHVSIINIQIGIKQYVIILDNIKCVTIN